MENYKPNSNKFKSEQKETQEKKIEKVVQGTVKTKKKNELSKFKEAFISEDARNVKTYILTDVIIPAAKKLISDIVKDGIEMLLYGGNSPRSKSSGGSRPSYISYNSYSSSRDDRSGDSRIRASGYTFEDVYLDNRGEAEDVLTRMDEIIDTYDMVSVADLYDLVGITGKFTDNKYGWTNLRGARVVHTRDGYLLDLPRPRVL